MYYGYYYDYELALPTASASCVPQEESVLMQDTEHDLHTDPPPEETYDIYGPLQPEFMGWTLSAWAIFYSTFSLASWAAYASRRSRWTFEEWLLYFEQDGAATPMEWARWICGIDL